MDEHITDTITATDEITVADSAKETDLSPEMRDGTVVVVENVGEHEVLDSDGNGNVYPNPFNGGNFQRWQFFGSSVFVIRNVQTGRVLDSNGNGNVYTLPANGGNFQKWRIIATPSTGLVAIRNVATNRFLEMLSPPRPKVARVRTDPSYTSGQSDWTYRIR
jgi:hypothetical protein